MRTTWHAANRDERGVALIYLALFLTILMIMAALVVDIGNARQQRANAQSAVDGAALSAAQVMNTTKTSQVQDVFDLAANTAFNSLSLHHAVVATGNCPAAGSAAVPPAVCQDYQYTSNAVVYDVQVTTPYIGPGEATPDTSMLHVQSCWNVPTVFGRVIGNNSIAICANATAQNGVGSGGPSNGGCGLQNEFPNVSIQNTFNKPVGQQTIQATYDTSSFINPFPLDTNSIHFVVQTQYGNFIQLTKDLSGISTPGSTYGMSPLGGGKTVTLSYTLPNSIDTTGKTASNTFSANLQVIDTAGRNCGNASWSTCGAGGHDPLFDGSVFHDVGNPSNSWGTDPNTALRGVTDDTDHSGIDLNTTVDPDDTVQPQQGSLITAGTPIGAIYNDENPLRAASVSMVIDGTTVGYGGSGWGSNTYTFVDPATVTNAAPTAIVGMPAFGTVDNAVSIAANNGGLQLTLLDTMGNPMPGETVSVSTIPGNQISGLDGIVNFSWPAADGTYTVTYTGVRGNGSFKVTTQGASIKSQTPLNVAPTGWPNAYPNTKGYNQKKLPLGGSMGIMYNSTGLKAGWHSAVLFANDGDVNNQGGDCGIVAWAFPSTGGSSGPGTLHLVT